MRVQKYTGLPIAIDWAINISNSQLSLAQLVWGNREFPPTQKYLPLAMVASDLSRKIIYIEFQWIHRYTPIFKLEQWFFHRFCEVCQDKKLERPLGMGDKVKTKIISINLPINELKTRKFIHCVAMSWTDVELPALWVRLLIRVINRKGVQHCSYL